MGVVISVLDAVGPVSGFSPSEYHASCLQGNRRPTERVLAAEHRVGLHLGAGVGLHLGAGLRLVQPCLCVLQRAALGPTGTLYAHLNSNSVQNQDFVWVFPLNS